MRKIWVGGAAFVAFAIIAAFLQTSAAPTLEMARAKTLPLEIPVSSLANCKADCEIAIEGSNLASQAITLVLRVDDAQSKSYATRFNEEFNLAPGPFKLNRSFDNLQAIDGRSIDSGAIRRIILFQASGEPGILLKTVELARAPSSQPAGATESTTGEKLAAITVSRATQLPIDVPIAKLKACSKALRDRRRRQCLGLDASGGGPARRRSPIAELCQPRK